MRIPYTQLLGGMSPDLFLAEYWQKKPLLVRQAVPNFDGLLSADELRKLACRDDAVSRLVEFERGAWMLEHGPFNARRWSKLADHWTLLVQNANHFDQAAAELFYSFDFIPQARLDDLQISLSPAQGGIGAHLDSYDVFLLQAKGRKHWQISSQSDDDFLPDAPLRILADFKPEHEWTLEPGDMLYLPPGVAHYGVALEEGMTYSIGFRAFSTQELAQAFLNYLSDRLELNGRYADPDLKVTDKPARIDQAMCRKVAQQLQDIRWDERIVSDFLGSHLSEPKPHVYFEPPKRPLSLSTFSRRLNEEGVRLDLKSQLLYRERSFFFNGEAISTEDDDEAALLEQLADRRHLPPGLTPSAELTEWLYQSYCDGALQLGVSDGRTLR